MNQKILMRKRTILSGASVVVVIAFWYLITAVFGLIKPLFLPSPDNVVRTFISFLYEPYAGHNLWGHAAASLQLVLFSFFLAIGIGIPLGVLMGWFKTFDAIVNPLFQMMRPIPPLAWIPLAIVWFGIGIEAKMFVIWLAAFVPSVINSYTGIKLVDQVLIQAARTFGANKLQILREVAIPSSLPVILAGMRISLGVSWMTLVASELLAATAGLGYAMQIARRSMYPEVIVVNMLVIGLLGAVMGKILQLFERRCCSWSENIASD
ncbi:MAG: ABC transporter permease [Chloroflexota bacterium]|jgi:taurine transport system permease protein